MSELKAILQWVTITGSKEDPIITHQFDEEENQLNISHMLDASEKDELDIVIAIPVDQRIGENKPVGNPFVAIDLRTGMMNVNQTNWNFVPHGIDPLSVKFRPIWYHSVRKSFALADVQNQTTEIVLYKIGWQFTYEEKNYQRILFYNVKDGSFSLKEKR